MYTFVVIRVKENGRARACRGGHHFVGIRHACVHTWQRAKLILRMQMRHFEAEWNFNTALRDFLSQTNGEFAGELATTVYARHRDRAIWINNGERAVKFLMTRGEKEEVDFFFCRTINNIDTWKRAQLPPFRVLHVAGRKSVLLHVSM